MHQSVRPSPVFLALLAITAVGGVLAWTAAQTVRPLAYVGVFVFVIGGWLVSLCLHEFGHAYTAWRFGDHDVAARGYLTLNPLKYSHPLLSLGLPLLFIALGGIGLPGGAVYLRTGLMTARQRTIVNLAGPFANLVLARGTADRDAGCSSTPSTGCSGPVWRSSVSSRSPRWLLNLLPIPGLDGFAALEPHLSPATQRALEPAKQFGFLILLVVLLAPGPNRWFFSTVFWIFDLFGVSRGLAFAGMDLTRFWSAWT